MNRGARALAGKAPEKCKKCSGRGILLGPNKELTKCSCAFTRELLMYMAPFSKVKTPGKKVTQAIETGVKGPGSFVIKVNQMPDQNLRGVLAGMLLHLWQITSRRFSYRLMDTYELVELWFGKREDLGDSLYSDLGAEVLVMFCRSSSPPNKNEVDLIKTVIASRSRRGLFTWLVLDGCGYPSDLPEGFFDNHGFKPLLWCGITA